MTDVTREKYAKLMAEIADLESRVESLESNLSESGGFSGTEDATTFEQELHDLREQLAEKRNELARLSDGCGKPHSQQ